MEVGSEHDPMEQPTYDDNTGTFCSRIPYWRMLTQHMSQSLGSIDVSSI